MTSTDDATPDRDTTQSDTGISDDQLPEDLRPEEDNPLAEPLDEDVDPDDLDVLGGKGAEETSEETGEG